MVSCTPAQVDAKLTAANQIVASYYVYYITCKLDKDQSSAERTTSRQLIANLYNNRSNTSFRGQMANLACAFQLSTSNTSIQNMARNAAGSALALTGRIAKNCGGSGGGGGGFGDIQGWLSGNTGGIPNFVIIAGIGALALFLFMRR